MSWTLFRNRKSTTWHRPTYCLTIRHMFRIFAPDDVLTFHAVISHWRWLSMLAITCWLGRQLQCLKLLATLLLGRLTQRTSSQRSQQFLSRQMADCLWDCVTWRWEPVSQVCIIHLLPLNARFPNHRELFQCSRYLRIMCRKLLGMRRHVWLCATRLTAPGYEPEYEGYYDPWPRSELPALKMIISRFYV